MPATGLTVSDCPHKYSVYGKAVTLAAADASNGNDFTATSDMLLVAYNSGATGRTITIASQPLPQLIRKGDVAAQAIAAGEIRVFRLTKDGWQDAATKKITVTASHAEVKLGVVDLTKESQTA